MPGSQLTKSFVSRVIHKLCAIVQFFGLDLGAATTIYRLLLTASWLTKVKPTRTQQYES